MKLVREFLYEYLGFTQAGDPIRDMGIGIETLIVNWLRNQGIKNHNFALSHTNRINAYDTIVLSGANLNEFPEYIKFNSIRGGFHCNNNNLTSLKGSPVKVSGSFMCSHNKLQNLIGGPREVEGAYAASNNDLNSLEGIALEIGEAIYLNDNNLRSLKYIPNSVGEFYITNNPIETIKYFPTEIWGDLHYTKSKILNKEKILSICQVSGDIYEY